MNKSIGRGKRNCCIIGCSNSDYQLLKWLNSHPCSRPSIEECNCEPPFKLFPFPGEKTDPESKNQWTRLVNRKNSNNSKKVWQSNKNSRVCSSHFVDRKPTTANPNPTLNLGHQNVKIPQSRKRPAERNSIPVLPKVKKPQANDGHEENTGVPEQMTIPPIELPQTPVNMGREGLQANSGSKADLPTSCKNCGSKKKNIRQMTNVLTKKNEEISRLNKKNLAQKKTLSFGPHMLVTDQKVKFYTGIPSRKAFDSLYGLLLPNLRKLRRWHGPSKVSSPVKHFAASPKKAGRTRKLYGKNEFLLTLMKLRLGLLNQDLGDRFHISTTTVSKILTTWFSFLSADLVPLLLFNPPKEAVQLTLPKSFKTPVVMADKGFQIREDLLLRRAELHIPPGRRGAEQMSKAGVKKTQEVANRRIYVEMAIRRLKSFRILKYELPLTLISQIDDIIFICAALCNLYPQLAKK
ncbi:uncharacterized protein LOC111330135 [Paramuricea clavata]|uniref:Uncharacterized protein LOC111330135 n=1 Tax=Paramuricea clavata TaxID=317549 RepID=A0A7D9DU62_PARCT|nr:uncharacterized protein LOC111330135 [Paramuricea clavata]